MWIDNGERGNHGMGLGVFAWSGKRNMPLPLSEMEDGRSEKCQLLIYHLSRGCCLLTLVGPSVAGCIEN